MLTVWQSNRLEVLADRAADVLRDRDAERSPLAPDSVVVQNAGMRRWLAMRVARSVGVCAGVEFALPAEFVWRAFRTVLRDVPERDSYDVATTTWALCGLLARTAGDPRFAAVDRYVGAPGPPDVARWELARELADAFSQYLFYRPDRVRAWEDGEPDLRSRTATAPDLRSRTATAPDLRSRTATADEAWQAELWRRLVGAERGGAARHFARLERELHVRLSSAAATGVRLALPARVLLFGIPALPPALLDVLRHLAVRVDVDLFLLNPSRAYWFDIRTYREQALGARRARSIEPSLLHLDVGNSLLASLGKQSRDFIASLLAADDEHVRHRELFEDPLEPGGGDPPALLHLLQSDVLELRERGGRPLAGAPDAERFPRPVAIARGDRSLQLHVCHGPMREVEVLHDRLLDLFDRHPDLRPADVVVMTPDIERYAPCVEAVFATAPRARQIPFSIADRSLAAESPVVAAFLSLLELPGSRYDANHLLDLLELAAVQRRFGLDAEQVEIAHRWVRDTGIRWGVDGASKAALGLPETGEHTWRFGLDRLLLGYALPGGGTQTFRDVLPYDEVEGAEAQTLGRLATLLELLFAIDRDLAPPRSPEQWSADLARLTDSLFLPDDADEPSVRAIRGALDGMREAAERAGFEDAISLDVVKLHLRRALEVPAGQNRFLAGRVTFCAMVPMRSIPFEVVCLIGLNADAFPRSHRAPGFDLIACEHRHGDRSRREDDRYLFLEALLSARRCLYVSYVGRSIRDNTDRPPSVVVSELLDAAARSAYLEGDADAPDDVRAEHLREMLETKHPLQPFSRKYFAGDEHLFSYASEMCTAVAAAMRAPAVPAPLFRRSLPAEAAEGQPIDIDRFVRFFDHPTRRFVQDRLRIRLEEGEGLVEDSEPFELDGLAGYDVKSRLLELLLAGEPPERLLALLRAAGRLPHRRLGEACFADELHRTRAFARRLRALRPDAPPRRVAVGEIAAGDLWLTGTLECFPGAGLVAGRPAWVKARDEIGLWIRHLAACELRRLGRLSDDLPPSACHVGSNRTFSLAPVDRPDAELARLAEIYRRGQTEPLPFFPAAARAWAEAVRKQSGDPLAAARAIWEGDDEDHQRPGPRPEREDPYIRFAFRDGNPIDERFADLAASISLRMLAHEAP